MFDIKSLSKLYEIKYTICKKTDCNVIIPNHVFLNDILFLFIHR